jgi:predicted PurR-regulated permease PerM
MLPALLIAWLSYGWLGVGVIAILYYIIQQSENNILIPLVMYNVLGVSPLLIFLCMVIGGSLFGFLGILLAVPFAVILNILFEDYKREKTKHKDKS